MKCRNKIFILTFIMICSTLLMGAGLINPPSLSLDTKEYKTYQNTNISTLISVESSGDKAVIKTYDDKYYAVIGYIRSKKANNKKIELSVNDMSNEQSIICEIKDKSIINRVAEMPENTKVIVYGKISIGIGNSIVLEVDYIDKTNYEALEENSYSTRKGGGVYRLYDFVERSLNNRSIKYYIPKDWESVEHSLQDEKLGVIEGYQYRLNEIGKKSEYAQSLYVCYFDINKYVAPNDKSEKKLIEEAIIRDILDKEEINKFPVSKVKTYYGTEYKYYQDSFEKKLVGDKYQVEFVFQETGSEGIVVYLYVYTVGHEDVGRIKEEIMMTMRLLETN